MRCYVYGCLRVTHGCLPLRYVAVVTLLRCVCPTHTFGYGYLYVTVTLFVTFTDFVGWFTRFVITVTLALLPHVPVPGLVDCNVYYVYTLFGYGYGSRFDSRYLIAVTFPRWLRCPLRYTRSHDGLILRIATLLHVYVRLVVTARTLVAVTLLHAHIWLLRLRCGYVCSPVTAFVCFTFRFYLRCVCVTFGSLLRLHFVYARLRCRVHVLHTLHLHFGFSGWLRYRTRWFGYCRLIVHVYVAVVTHIRLRSPHGCCYTVGYVRTFTFYVGLTVTTAVGYVVVGTGCLPVTFAGLRCRLRYDVRSVGLLVGYVTVWFTRYGQRLVAAVTFGLRLRLQRYVTTHAVADVCGLVTVVVRLRLPLVVCSRFTVAFTHVYTFVLRLPPTHVYTTHTGCVTLRLHCGCGWLVVTLVAVTG